MKPDTAIRFRKIFCSLAKIPFQDQISLSTSYILSSMRDAGVSEIQGIFGDKRETGKQTEALLWKQLINSDTQFHTGCTRVIDSFQIFIHQRGKFVGHHRRTLQIF